MKYHTEILSEKQKKLLPKLEPLRDKSFYLAGGTGLAIYIGHRTSLDFDFYSFSSFVSEDIYSLLKQKMGSILPIQKQKDTLILKCEGLNVSLFAYPYDLLRPPEPFEELLLASIEDIAAMKLIAIIQRGSKRDFIDFYYLIKRFGLKKILEFTAKKYEDFNFYLALQALVYFDDAEKEELSLRHITLHKSLEWEEVKNYIRRETKKIR